MSSADIVKAGLASVYVGKRVSFAVAAEKADGKHKLTHERRA